MSCFFSPLLWKNVFVQKEKKKGCSGIFQKIKSSSFFKFRTS